MGQAQSVGARSLRGHRRIAGPLIPPRLRFPLPLAPLAALTTVVAPAPPAAGASLRFLEAGVWPAAGAGGATSVGRAGCGPSSSRARAPIASRSSLSRSKSATKKPSVAPCARSGPARAHSACQSPPNPRQGQPGSASPSFQPCALPTSIAFSTTSSFSCRCTLHVEYTSLRARGRRIARVTAASWKAASFSTRVSPAASTSGAPPLGSSPRVARPASMRKSPRERPVPLPEHDGSSSTASALASSASTAGGGLRKSATCAEIMPSAPVARALVRRRCSRTASRSSAMTRPRVRRLRFQSDRLSSSGVSSASASARSAARCVVLLPGAAQPSTTVQPARGARARAGRQLARLCCTSVPSATRASSCRSVPGGKRNTSGISATGSTAGSAACPSACSSRVTPPAACASVSPARAAFR
mmetsp:Transcript_3769/g.15229  ORF Transcript_3769/g.15229 Transcript_3769/m.15229 type:complete len:416 (-) Transcript_3769:428-1675(-)